MITEDVSKHAGVATCDGVSKYAGVATYVVTKRSEQIFSSKKKKITMKDGKEKVKGKKA